MKSKGWVKIDRGILDHWIWNQGEAFDVRSAWMDLILLANHKDSKGLLGGRVVQCRRGEVNRSVLSLADRWGWSRGKVTRFLELLAKDGMITTNSTPFGTTISIVNYGKFQSQRATGDTTLDTAVEQRSDNGRTGVGQRSDTNKNIKNDKNDKNDKNNIRRRPAADDLALFSIPVRGGGVYEISEEDLESWQAFYPTLDLHHEFRAMHAWCFANQDKQKTQAGMKRFINSWLARSVREQEEQQSRAAEDEPTSFMDIWRAEAKG